MNTTKQIEILIGQSKNGGAKFSSLQKSDNLIDKIHNYSKENIYVFKSHASISLMMCLDEINKQQREIELLKETINSIS